MVVVVDTCSFHRLVEYYLPLDKKGQLVPLFEQLFFGHEIIMTESVFLECSRMSKGIITTKLPFLKTKAAKDILVKPDFFPPDAKLQRIVNENFTIKAKFQSLPLEQQLAQSEAYMLSGDFSILQCAYMEKKGMAGSLFGDDLRVLTDESSAENDNKCFKKIPACCRFLNADTISIREYLEIITEGKIELIISR